MIMKPIRYRNEYYCDRCNKSWERYAETQLHDRCPNCNSMVEPLKSERMFAMLELTAFAAMSDAQIAKGLLGWIENTLMEAIRKHLDNVNPIHIETSMNLQFRAQEIRFLKKEGEQVWVVTRDILKVFNESRIDDRS